MKAFDLSAEQYGQVEILAGVGYSARKIAVFLEVDVNLFVECSKDKDSAIYKAIARGSLQADYEVNKAMLISAKSGNATQTQRLDKLRYAQKVETEKERIFYES